LVDVDTDEKIILRVNLKGKVWEQMDRIYVAQDRDHWCAGEHVNETAGSIKVENFLGD
jgi:hypothetical protein